MDSRVSLLYSDAKIAIGAYENVHLVCYRQSLDLDMLRRDRAAHDALAKRYPKGFGLVCTSQPNLSLPTQEVRRESAYMLQANRGRVLAAAVVVGGDGFWASAARSVITGINLVATPPYPIKIFDEVMPASGWLAPQVPNLPGGSFALTTAIRELSEAR